MICLGEKIAIFSEMVCLKKEGESKEKIEVERARLDRALTGKTWEVGRKEEDLIARRIQLTKEQGYDQVTSTKKETQIEVSKRERTLSQDFVVNLKDKLRDLRADDAHIQREEGIFKGVLADVNKGRIRAYLINQDQDRLEAASNKTTEGEGIHLDFPPLEERTLGGFMVSDKEEGFFINANFQTKIGNLNYESGKMPHDQLKVEGGMD